METNGENNFPMKTRSLLPILMIGLIVVNVSSSQAQTVLLSYWNFNNVSTQFSSPNIGVFANTDGGFGEVAGNYKISGNTSVNAVWSNANDVNLNFTNSLGTPNGNFSTSKTGWGVYNDSGLNKLANDTSVNKGSLILMTSTVSSSSSVQQFDMQLKSTGYQDLQLNYASRYGVINSTAIESWSYSLDGTNFISIGDISIVNGGNAQWGTYSLNLGSALDDLGTFYLRMEVTAPVGYITSVAFDNIQFTGVAAIPEPSTWALISIGLLTIGFLRLRKSRA